MTHRDYRETFSETPGLLALWDRTTRLYQEFPGFMFVKRTPFLITANGKVCKYPLRKVALISGDVPGPVHHLMDELSLIEYMLHCDFLKKKDVARLERRSKKVLRCADRFSHMATRQEYARLQRRGASLH